MGYRIYERLRTMNAKLLFAAATLLVAGSVFAAPKSQSPEPKIPVLKDPNPYANYGSAMKSNKNWPMAVEWQGSNSKAIKEATSCKALKAIASDRAKMDALLAKVKEAYRTSPLDSTQIAAITQFVMCKKNPDAPKMRSRWIAAILQAAKNAPDAYRKLFFFDQLRWCGRKGDIKAIKNIAKASGDKAVQDFAEMVAKELNQAFE